MIAATDMLRRSRLALYATAGLLLVVTAVWLWLWWPTTNTLMGYASRGDVGGVRLSLMLGVDPNEPSRYGWQHENAGQTPLTAAAQFGRVDVVRFLLSHGADPNLRDGGAEFPHATPLATAATHGQLDVCRVLLEAGADPNIPTEPKGANWTALDWARAGGHSAVANLLRQHGAVDSGRARIKQ